MAFRTCTSTLSDRQSPCGSVVRTRTCNPHLDSWGLSPIACSGGVSTRSAHATVLDSNPCQRATSRTLLAIDEVCPPVHHFASIRSHQGACSKRCTFNLIDLTNPCSVNDAQELVRTVRERARHAANGSAPPDGARSNGNRTLMIVPVPSELAVVMVPPSWRTKIAT